MTNESKFDFEELNPEYLAALKKLCESQQESIIEECKNIPDNVLTEFNALHKHVHNLYDSVQGLRKRIENLETKEDLKLQTLGTAHAASSDAIQAEIFNKLLKLEENPKRYESEIHKINSRINNICFILKQFSDSIDDSFD